jgi:hypothetical protein
MIVSTRLRQTDKRLRKIHSNNNSNTLGEKSENFNQEENEKFIFIFFVLEKTTEVTKVPILLKRPTVIFRHKNGRFTSPSNEGKSANTVS